MVKINYIFKPQEKNKNYIDIIYNGKVYGSWNNEANIDYHEDLTLERDLSELIDIGIEIGRQIQKDEKALPTVSNSIIVEE